MSECVMKLQIKMVVHPISGTTPLEVPLGWFNRDKVGLQAAKDACSITKARYSDVAKAVDVIVTVPGHEPIVFHENCS